MAYNYIMVEGNRIDLTEEQVETLKNALNENKDDDKSKMKSPFDRVDSYESYYCVTMDGGIEALYEEHSQFDDRAYQIANYCTDKNLIQQQVYRETLNRLLWRFTYQNGWSDDLWEDNDKRKYCIFYNYFYDRFDIDYNDTIQYNMPYFISEEIAQRAIDKIVFPFMKEHPDFNDFKR